MVNKNLRNLVSKGIKGIAVIVRKLLQYTLAKGKTAGWANKKHQIDELDTGPSKPSTEEIPPREPSQEELPTPPEERPGI